MSIKKLERALFTNLPNKFYKIKNIKVAGPKKAICTEYFSAEEIEEKETSALLNEKENEEQTKIKQEVKAESAASQTKIFTNCIEDKMPPNPDKTYKVSILSISERASENPTLWNKIWYDYLGQ